MCSNEVSGLHSVPRKRGAGPPPIVRLVEDEWTNLTDNSQIASPEGLRNFCGKYPQTKVVSVIPVRLGVEC